jgi:hypothetical protein
VDVADITEGTRNSGKWVVGYTTDGSHENSSGNLAVAAGIPAP